MEGFMVDYEKLYHLMVNASEDTIAEIERQNYGSAKEILVAAEQRCEEIYIDAPQDA